MKVIYFHQHFVTPSGAGGVRSYAMARRLIDRGHQVTMVCGSFAECNTGLDGSFANGIRRGFVDGIQVIELDLTYSNADSFLKRALTFVKFALRSVGLVFTEKYDLVFATTTPLTAGIPGIVARFLRGKPFVFEVRDLWPELPRAMGVIRNPLLIGAMSMLEWVSYHSAHRIVGLSPGIIQGIANRGVSLDRIALVPNGCDMDIFGADVKSWRPEKVKRSDFMAIFAGTHGIANGLNAVLDAAVELKCRGCEEIKLVLIGQGKLKLSLKARAEMEGLDNVVFYEQVNKARIAGLLAASDLGLQILANVPAFYYGTSPNKFFDYIAAGLPVLNNYPGWLAEMITEHRCGFVVTPDNPVAFADALVQAASDRDSLKAMGQRSRALAEAHFDRTVLSDLWVDWVVGAKT
jgi:glycosyltransferase involved in cell wall biosynthesis